MILLYPILIEYEFPNDSVDIYIIDYGILFSHLNCIPIFTFFFIVLCSLYYYDVEDYYNRKRWERFLKLFGHLLGFEASICRKQQVYVYIICVIGIRTRIHIQQRQTFSSYIMESVIGRCTSIHIQLRKQSNRDKTDV